MIDDEIRKIVQEELEKKIEELKDIKRVSISEKYDDVLTPKEISKILKISVDTVYTLCKNPKFPTVNLGHKRILIPRDRFFEWLLNNDDDIEK